MTIALVAIADPEEIRRQADEIVRRPEFREEQPSVVERALDWIFDQLGDFVSAGAGSGGYALGYAILAVAVAAAAYFVWKVFPRGRLTPKRDTFSVATDTVARRSRAEWLAEAERAEAAGDWEQAVHARYYAIASGLAEHDRLPAEPSTTSGERRSAFAEPPSEPARVAVFDDATDTYEHVWFGGHPADEPDSRRLAEADRSLLDGGGP